MCLFCKIVNKEIAADIVYENDEVMAFKDINPKALVHVLIVPKVHIKNVGEITKDNAKILGAIHLAANEIAKKMGIFEDGYRLITNCGEGAGQTVWHLHYHLLGGEGLKEEII